MSSQLFQISWHLGKSPRKPADHVLIFVILIDDAFKLQPTGVQRNGVYYTLNIKKISIYPRIKKMALCFNLRLKFSLSSSFRGRISRHILCIFPMNRLVIQCKNHLTSSHYRLNISTNGAVFAYAVIYSQKRPRAFD